MDAPPPLPTPAAHQATQRSGRLHAWATLAFLIGIPVALTAALVPIFLYPFLDSLDYSEADDNIELHNKLVAWSYLFLVFSNLLLTAGFLLRLIELVLVDHASPRLVIRPFHCDHVCHGNSLEQVFSCRCHYQVQGRTYYKTLPPKSFSATGRRDDQVSLVVHPEYPQLALPEEETGACMLAFQVIICFFLILVSLLLASWAVYELKASPVWEWVLGLTVCVGSVYLLYRYEDKCTGGPLPPELQQLSLTLAPLIWAALIGGEAPSEMGEDSGSSNVHQVDDVGYFAAA